MLVHIPRNPLNLFVENISIFKKALVSNSGLPLGDLLLMTINQPVSHAGINLLVVVLFFVDVSNLELGLPAPPERFNLPPPRWQGQRRRKNTGTIHIL